MRERERVVFHDDANGGIRAQNRSEPLIVHLKIRRGQVHVRCGLKFLSSVAERAERVQNRERSFVLSLRRGQSTISMEERRAQ
jgi:hypothetical protein